jgi:hypothetical protein
MHSSMAGRHQGHLTRCARRLGLDRNPLRRRMDRQEAAIRLVVIILVIVAVPLAAVAVGQRAYHSAVRHAHAQQTSNHLVNAVLLQSAPATGALDPYSPVEYASVLARWKPPGLPARSGQVLAPAGARKGSTVPTWVNASGAVTEPPMAHRDIVGDVWTAVILTVLASCMALLAAGVIARIALDRRRLNAWDAEWRATGPLWSGHPS